MDRKTRPVQIAFESYVKFYEKSGLGRNRKRAFTFDDFDNSQLYGAFVRFAKFATERNLRADQYLEWAIERQLPIDDWCKESALDDYRRHSLLRERPHKAIERSLIAMSEWCKKNKVRLGRFFSAISTNEATLWIRQGILSPWMMYICDRADELTSRMSTEQLEMLNQTADPRRWRVRILANKEDVVDIKRNVLGPLNLGGIDDRNN